MKLKVVVMAAVLLAAAAGGISPGAGGPELKLEFCGPVNLSDPILKLLKGAGSPGVSTSPRLAVDGAGDIYVAWEEDWEKNREIFLARLSFKADCFKIKPPTTEFDKVFEKAKILVRNVSENPGVSKVPDLAVGVPGTGFVAWQDTFDPETKATIRNPAILLRRFAIVAEKEKEIIKLLDTLNISERPEVVAQRPTIAIDRLGRSFVAWEQATERGLEIFFRGSPPYSPRVSVSQGRTVASLAPRVAVDRAGRLVFVVWQGQEQAFVAPEIFISRSANAGESFVRPAFDLPTNISGPASPGASEQPDITVDKAGVQLVVWSDNTRRDDNPEGDFEIFFRRSTEAFLPPFNVSGSCKEGSKVASRQPAIAVDGAGNVLVAWQEDVDAKNKEIFFTSAILRVPEPIECVNISKSPGASGLPAIALDGFENIFIVWEEDVGGGNTEIFFVAIKRAE